MSINKASTDPIIQEEYVMHKRCSKCRSYKPLHEFNRSRTNIVNQFNRQNQCRKCQSKQYDDMKSVVYRMSFKSITSCTIEYYGQSTVYEHRTVDHKSKLKNNKHGNKKCQEEFNKLIEQVGLDKALESLKFEIQTELTDTEKTRLIEISSKGKDYLSKYLLKLEKEINDARIKEVIEKELNVKVVS